MSTSQSYCAFLFTAAILGTGCSGGVCLREVNGSVNVDNKPLKEGAISFQPLNKDAARGSGAIIVDGEFNIPQSCGLEPGDYLVTVESSQPTSRTRHDFFAGSVTECTPMRFKEDGHLRVTVKSRGSNYFDIRLSLAGP